MRDGVGGPARGTGLAALIREHATVFSARLCGECDELNCPGGDRSVELVEIGEVAGVLAEHAATVQFIAGRIAADRARYVEPPDA